LLIKFYISSKKGLMVFLYNKDLKDLSFEELDELVVFYSESYFRWNSISYKDFKNQMRRINYYLNKQFVMF
jgi:hypothetical protein